MSNWATVSDEVLGALERGSKASLSELGEMMGFEWDPAARWLRVDTEIRDVYRLLPQWYRDSMIRQGYVWDTGFQEFRLFPETSRPPSSVISPRHTFQYDSLLSDRVTIGSVSHRPQVTHKRKLLLIT